MLMMNLMCQNSETAEESFLNLVTSTGIRLYLKFSDCLEHQTEFHLVRIGLYLHFSDRFGISNRKSCCTNHTNRPSNSATNSRARNCWEKLSQFRYIDRNLVVFTIFRLIWNTKQNSIWFKFRNILNTIWFQLV